MGDLVRDAKKFALGLKLMGVALEKDIGDFANAVEYVRYQYSETKRAIDEKLAAIKDPNDLTRFIKKINSITGLSINVGGMTFAEAVEFVKMEIEDRMEEKRKIMMGGFDVQ